MKTLITSLIVGLLSLPTMAAADSNSLLTLGMGAQYSFSGADAAAESSEVSGYQYGLVSRLKVLRFIGVEGVVQLDEDPKTQSERLLSPRFQIGAMLNLVPTSYFNLFVVAGVAAQDVDDLFNLDGETTSFHAGPGLEIFIGEHVAIGGDLRFRLPGSNHIKHLVEDTRSTAPVEEAMDLEIWQANLTVSYYL